MTLRVAALVLLFGPSLSLLAQERQIPPEVLHYADLVLHNGKILTADDAFTIAQAIAVRDGNVLAVGTNERIRAMAGPSTSSIDLRGKTVIPGLIDTHFHLHSQARNSAGFAVRGSDVRSALEDVKTLVAATPAGEIIYARIRVPRGESSKVEWEMTRQHLDAVSPNNPVILDTGRAHVIVNTLALKGANIPPGTSGIVKDPATGEPTGQIEPMAYGIVRVEYAPWIPIEQLIPPLKKGMREFTGWGITTVTSRVPGNELSALRQIWKDGDLTMRWRIHLEDLIDTNPRTEAHLKRIGNLSDIGDDLFRIVGAHAGVADGRIGDGTASTLRPKLRPIPKDAAFNWVGLNGWDRWPEEEMESAVTALRYGWNVMGIHASGDGASAKILKALEEGRKDPIVSNKDQRLGLDHWTMASPEQIEKARSLGGVYTNASAQQLFRNTEGTSYFYGADNMNGWLPLKTLITAGLRPTLAMDGSGGPNANPFWQMETVIIRKDERGRVWNAGEAVSREEALRMYTNWSAYYIGDQDKLGTLEPGKLADLVVLDRDYMTIAGEDISEIRVAMTFLGGKLVYGDESR